MSEQMTAKVDVDLAQPSILSRRNPLRYLMLLGGLGSILGAVVAGFLVGLVEAYGIAYAPTYAQIVIFVLMAIVVLVRPSGLFGREEVA